MWKHKFAYTIFIPDNEKKYIDIAVFIADSKESYDIKKELEG